MTTAVHDTRVTVTGTGTPIATPNRAGPGVLVSHGSTQLQFDAGRSTVMRLTELGHRVGRYRRPLHYAPTQRPRRWAFRFAHDPLA